MTAGGKVLLISCALLASLGGNVYLARQVLRLHRERILLTLELFAPTAFERENRALGPPKGGKPRLIYFGDSRVAEWLRLPELHSVEPINRGRAGDTTAMALARLGQDAIDLAPQAVVLQLGINDLKAIAVQPGRASRIAESARRNVESLVVELRQSGIEVVVLKVWPRGPTDLARLPFRWTAVDRAIEDFNGHLEALTGQGVTVVDCDPLLALRGRLDRRYARDMLHLNEEGYERLNACLTPLLTQFVERLSPRLVP